MVKWEDPEVIALSFRAYTLLLHVIVGAYLWEYAINLDFDWLVLRGRRKLTRGAAFYLLLRYTALFVICVSLGVTNAFHDPGCKAWMYVQRGSANIAMTLASGLLYARVWAISEGNPIIVWGIGLLYLGNWGTMAYGIYMAEGVYLETMFICVSGDVEAYRLLVIYQLTFDLICLSTMLFLLLRMHHGGSNSLWKFLVNQGVLYFVAICSAYILDLAFEFSAKHLNTVVSQIPSVFRVLVTCIAALRMQRGLIEFVDKRPAITSTRVTTGTGDYFPRGASGMRSAGAVPGTETAIELSVEVQSWPDRNNGAYNDSKHGLSV
ncbi:hypothetical protein BKA62DRAFT_774765 [Auriculariales sp. MPI-PUGE-AT-0066]|nr:hypothetical protein BKA62DRAFT_774765 [Auriculariales sp. MPI-PUGE-AT-0066]